MKERRKYVDINNFYHTIFTKPFEIEIFVTDNLNLKEEQINTIKSLKSDECVICLNKAPNILFCNCGHIPICGECEEMKPLDICPICKTRNSIKRII